MPLPSLTPKQWEQAGQLFDRLSNTPHEQRRLDQLDCDVAVVAVVSEMLATSDSEDPFVLDRTMHRLSAALLDSGNHPPVEKDYRNHRFGPWRAVEKIGRGGMGIVLRGERADGEFDKTVAIKLLPGTGEPLAEGRLAEEIRILARLEHPNIARLIDGGVDDHGTRFLVMEYVDGRSITDHCRGLEQKARLDLFDQVLKAVDHAHRHLVVHCDLKPANILVTNEGQVRLVDFGIAGLLGDAASARGEHRGWFCSPGYASPEQLEGHAPSVSQDVFSLGAVLYEILTGKRLRNNRDATHLLLKPKRPDPAIALPSTLDRSIDRDLDAICLKALKAEPDERYESISELRRDLKFRKERLPVVARNGGRSYRASRFISRHRWALTAGLAMLAVSFVGILATLWQAGEARALAEQARLHAEQALVDSRRERAMRDFLVQLFQSNNPDIAQGVIPTARDLLELGRYQMESAFNDEPELRSEMLIVLGVLFAGLGEYQAARPLLDEGLAIEHNGPGLDLHTKALRAKAMLDRMTNQHESALELLNNAEYLLKDAGLIPGPMHARIMEDLGMTLNQMGRPGDAIVRLASVMDLARSQSDLPDDVLFDYQLALGAALIRGEQLDSAMRLLNEALMLDLKSDEAPSQRLHAHRALGEALWRQGDLEGALSHWQSAATLAQQLYPRKHIWRAITTLNLGVVFNTVGRLEEADIHLREAQEILMLVYGDQQHHYLWALHTHLGLNRHYRGRLNDAEKHLRQAREVAASSLGSDNPLYLIANLNLADLMVDLKRYGEAETLILEADQEYRKLFGPNHSRVAMSQAYLARLRLHQQRPAEALEHAVKALDGFHHSGYDNPRYLLFVMRYGTQALLDLGRTDEAQAMLGDALELGAAAGISAGMEWPRLLATRAQFLTIHDADNALEAVIEAEASLRNIFGADHPATKRMQALFVSLNQTAH